MGYISLANRDPLFPWWHKIQIMTKPRFYVTGCLVSGLATIVAAAPCTLCADGSPLTKPNATLDSLAEEFGFVPTCSIVQAELDLVSADSSQCSETQLLGSYCGCPRVDDYCRACEDPPESFSEQNLPHFRDHFGYDLSCKQASMVMSQLESDSQMCRVMSDHIWLCGCNGGNKQYYGANTREEKALLAWLPRVASIFSIMVRGTKPVCLTVGTKEVRTHHYLYDRCCLSRAHPSYSGTSSETRRSKKVPSTRSFLQ